MLYPLLVAALLKASSCAAIPTASPFTFYDMPTALSGPCDICEGHDGYVYIQNFLVDTLVKLDPATGERIEYQIPYKNPPAPTSVLPGLGTRTALACAIRPGNDGKIYAASGVRNEIVVLDPQTGSVEVFAQPANNPLGNLFPFNDLWPGETGMFFSQVTGNTVSLFDYDTHDFQNFQPPTPQSGPLGMRTSTDGALWFTEFLARKIGRLNATSGQITEYPLPITLQGPSVLRVEEGPYLYFTAQEGNGIGRIEKATGEIDVYTYPVPLSLPTEDTQDKDGNVWFSTISQNSLQYLTPSTGKFTTIPLPGNVLGLVPPFVNIAINYGPGNAIWFAELTTNKVGRYQID